MEADVASVVWDEQAQDLSAQYVGRWCRLVSTTNWEKGRIICLWREDLIAAGQPSTSYSDDAWSQQVGGVSPQHVGRLRRVAQRFDAAREKYTQLFWSHFLAALDWDEAEMWLEGAVQNRWSVAQMRRQRAETLGLVDELGPTPDAVQSVSDAWSAEEGTYEAAEPAAEPWSDVDASPSGSAERNAGDEETPPWDASSSELDADLPEAAADDAAQRPFADLAQLSALPDDLATAFESFQIAILRHKLGGWVEVRPELVVKGLDHLRELVYSDTASK